MNHSFSASPYQGSFKMPSLILAGLSILTIASFFLLSISFIPLVVSSLVLIHAFIHLLLKHLLTFKATDETALIINDSTVIFKTGKNIHWEINTSNIQDIQIDHPKYSLIFSTKDNDSYSIIKYCFDMNTSQKIKAIL
ncbi:hypothetical protein [Marinicellulosiphila megalodicopiae]|uniref:hypothetical protein n=1 Tax=Marinicellulosiphila megalodicopiae TaxID=2724896 RepID=UPI003BAE4B3C